MTVAAMACLTTAVQGANSVYRNLILGDAPIVYFEFDEASGSTAVNSATTGATYDGTFNTTGGSVTVGQPSFAQGGTAYDFGGGFVGAASALTSSLDEWTVEAWVNYDSGKTIKSNFLGNDQGGWNDDVIFGIGPENGTVGVPAGSVGVIQQGSPGTTRDVAGAALAADEWHHIVMTGSTSAGRLDLYIDGILVDSDTSLVNDATFNGADGLLTAHLTIGANRPDASLGNAGGYWPYDGLLDEVAIYDAVLDAPAISKHYYTGLAAAYRNAVLADRPIIYYEFEETSGTTAINNGTLGASHNGTITGSVTLDQTSFDESGTAYDFGGGHVQAAAFPSLTEWTVEAWINWDAAKTSSSHIFGNDQAGWNDDVLFGIGSENGGVGVPASHVGIIQQGAPDGPRDFVETPLTHSEWHHVVASGSTIAGELKLYVDGVLIGTDSSPANGLTLNGAVGVYVGTDGSYDRAFDGLIDEFALYDSVLSATDVAKHFAAAPATWAGGATGSWDTAANWESLSVPASGDTVTISNAAVRLTDSSNYDPAMIHLTGTASLDIDGGGVAHFQNDTTFNIGSQANFGTGDDLFDLQGVTLNFESGATADLGVWEFAGSPATLQFNLDATGFETIHTGLLKPEYGDNSQFIWVVDMANYTGGAQTITLLDFSGLDGDGMTAAEFETGTLRVLNSGEYNSYTLSWNESTLAVEFTINEPITAPLGRQLFADNFNDGRMVNGSFLLRHISDSAWHHAGAWSVSSDALTATGDTDTSASEGAVAKSVRVGKVTGKVITLTFDYTLAAADESLSVFIYGSQINNAEFQYLSDDSDNDTMGNLSLAASNGSGRYQYLMTSDVISTEFVNGATLATNGTMGDGADDPCFANISGGTSGTFQQSVDLTQFGFDGVEDFDFITVVFARDAAAGSEVTIDDLSLVANMRPTTLLGVSAVANNMVKIVVDTPCPELLIPMTSPDLTEGSWTHVAHSNAPGNPFEVTNLGYSTVEGTNMEIYLPADTDKQFFRLQEAPKFTLWQLPSQGSGQMNSYVIQTAGGKLIVVDGGRTADGSYLKNFLAARGNHVHSWFISHPHKDHLDALSWILENQGDLVIDEIYAAIPPSEWMDQYYDSNAKSAVQAFTTALTNAGRSYVQQNAGDLFDIDEVHIEVLYAGNTDITTSSVNNSSVVMRVSDLTKTVLFTGDLEVAGGNHLVDTLEDGKLKADYVQMCHHGQQCAEKNFFELVDADYALWPTPPWLWDNDFGNGFNVERLTTIQTRRWMDELDVVLNYVSGLSGLSEIK